MVSKFLSLDSKEAGNKYTVKKDIGSTVGKGRLERQEQCQRSSTKKVDKLPGEKI